MDRRHFIAAVGAGAVTAVLPFKLVAETTKPLKVRIEPAKQIGFHVWKVGSGNNPATCADMDKVMENLDNLNTVISHPGGPLSRPPHYGWLYRAAPNDRQAITVRHEFVPLDPGPGHLLVYVGDTNRPATQADLAEIQEQMHKIFSLHL